MEAGAIAVRRVRKEDMRHVAKATGATMVIFVLVNIIHVGMLVFFSLGCKWGCRLLLSMKSSFGFTMFGLDLSLLLYSLIYPLLPTSF